MRIADLNWMQVEEYLRHDDRAVLPIGSTEQHAYLSLATDNLLAERVAVEAAEPLNVPVFPPINYGITPHFTAYPGTVSLSIGTLVAVVRDCLDSLAASGFKRILIVNGHGGNGPVQTLAGEWMADHVQVRVRFHNWWNAPLTLKRVREIDAIASHASWIENLPWTRLGGVSMPVAQKPMANLVQLLALAPLELRASLGDGNFGGFYQRPDADLEAIWKVAVEETRALLTAGW